MDERTREVLEHVFGEATTQKALLTPTKRDAERAIELIAEMPIGLILQEMGVIAAQRVADVITTTGLRPADFAGIPDIPQALIAKLVEALVTGDETFLRAFATQLAARG